MKNLILITIMIFSQSLLAKPIFSSMIKGDGNKLYIALKDESGKRPTPQLVLMNDKSLKISTIKVPKEIKSREVIALYHFNNSLLVLTQWTIEMGDEPLLHSYNTTTKKWKKLGKFKCPSFDNFSISNGAAQLHCEDKTIDKIAVKGLKGEVQVTLPQSSAKGKSGNTFTFKGLTYFWKEVVIKGTKGTKYLKAPDFF